MKLRWIAGAALLAALAACGDSTRSDPVPPDTLAIQAMAGGAAGAAALGLQAYTIGILVNAGHKPATESASSPAAGDTLLPGILTCPVVTAVAGGAGFLLGLDYGSGCASRLDGIMTSGRIEFTAAARAPSGLDLTADFRSFARGGRTVDGILEAGGSTGGAVAISAQALGVTGQGSTIILNMEIAAQRLLTGISNAASAAEPVYCAAWRIPSGSGSVEGVVGSEEIGFFFSVADTILVSTCCAYPTAGVLRITAAGLIPATVDFGDGACDNVATLTVAGHSQQITLGD